MPSPILFPQLRYALHDVVELLSYAPIFLPLAEPTKTGHKC
jgi:hypothetical protein